MKNGLWDLSTPCYIIDSEAFIGNIKRINDAFSSSWGENVSLGYSIKTNHTPWLLNEARRLGLWAEAVSGDEMNMAIREGADLSEIILNGPQKRPEEIEKVLLGGGIVNADNLSDIGVICSLAPRFEKQSVKVGIRINFDFERFCPGESTAGEEVSRFGICIENGDFERALKMLRQAGIPLSGLHLHYSTKTRSAKAFSALAQCADDLICRFSLIDELKYIDVGGGFFGGQVNSRYPTMDGYAEAICNILKKHINSEKVMLILEPGASVLATAVEYLCEIINERDIRGVRVLTVDGTVLHVNPFMAPRNASVELMYRNPDNAGGESVPRQLICGATCMEKDRLADIREAYRLGLKDRIKVHFAGAYTMGFNSCFINLPPRIYVKSGDGCSLLRAPLPELMSII